MSKLKFYSETEISRLRDIKALSGRERFSALTQFANDTNRTYEACYAKMATLNKRSTAKRAYTRSAPAKTVTMVGNEVRIAYKSVTVQDGELVFKI